VLTLTHVLGYPIHNIVNMVSIVSESETTTHLRILRDGRFDGRFDLNREQEETINELLVNIDLSLEEDVDVESTLELPIVRLDRRTK